MQLFSRWIGTAGLLLMVCWCSVAQATTLCKSLFRKKLYLRAAVCFSRNVRAFERRLTAKKTSFSAADKNRLYRGFRNVALSYHRASNQANRAVEKSYHLEKAYQQTQIVLQRKYYEYASQRDLIRVFGEKLKAEIGYVQVVLTTHSTDVWVEVTGGFQFSKQKRRGSVLHYRLRPGTYLFVAHRKGYPSQSQTLRLVPKQVAQSIQFKWRSLRNKTSIVPPQKRAPLSAPRRAMVWSFVSVGAAALVVGSVLVGVSIQQSYALNQDVAALQTARLSGVKHQGEDVANKHSLALSQSLQSNETLYATGWVVGGVGVALGVTAAVLFWVRPKPVSQPPTPVKLPGKEGSFLLVSESYF